MFVVVRINSIFFSKLSVCFIIEYFSCYKIILDFCGIELVIGIIIGIYIWWSGIGCIGWNWVNRERISYWKGVFFKRSLR